MDFQSLINKIRGNNNQPATTADSTDTGITAVNDSSTEVSETSSDLETPEVVKLQYTIGEEVEVPLCDGDITVEELMEDYADDLGLDPDQITRIVKVDQKGTRSAVDRDAYAEEGCRYIFYKMQGGKA